MCAPYRRFLITPPLSAATNDNKEKQPRAQCGEVLIYWCDINQLQLNNGKELVVDYRPNKAPNYHHPLREEVELLDPYKLRGILMDKAL